jgi:hypothetical protein
MRWGAAYVPSDANSRIAREILTSCFILLAEFEGL